MKKMTGAKFIAETLKGYGTTHVFFMEAVLRHTLIELAALGIKCILTHSEKTAAYMADGYAKASRKPGICMSQSVGAANIASGLQDPYLGRSPVIAFTGRQIPTSMHRNAYQEITHAPLFQPVTKFNACVETIEQLPHIIRQCFREATSGSPRPVHVDLIGHQAQVIELSEGEIEVIVDNSFTQYPALRPEPDSVVVKEAIRLVMDAKKPVIVAGGGAKASLAGAEIVEFAEMLQIPVATSLNGKGLILENHRLSIGIAGRYSCECANRAILGSDLVLFIGSSVGDSVSLDWKVPKPGTPIIQIDIDPSELGRNYPNTLPIIGDAKKTIRRFIELFNTQEIKFCPKYEWSQTTEQFVKEWKEKISPLRHSDELPMRVERVCKELTECLPRNAVLVADTGFASSWTGTMVYLTHPEQSYIRCAGSLGWAFPGSLGVKCALPEKPVICFTGDGGFYYHLSELETASRCGINTITIVNNNSALGQCWVVLKNVFQNNTGKEEMCMFSCVNFAKIAESFGCTGIRVERPGDISSAMKTALEAKGPVVLELITDPNCKAPTARD